MYPVANWRGPAFRALAVSVLALAGLTGCTLVGDSLTGVSVNKEARGTCVTDCAIVAKAAIDAETTLHEDNVAACQGLPAEQITTCMADEGARHAAAMQSIMDTRLQCMNSCHSQGQGIAG